MRLLEESITPASRFAELITAASGLEVRAFEEDPALRTAFWAEFNGEADATGLTFLTVREVAQLLKIPENRVYDLAARGQIPCVRVGERQLRFIQEDLLAWARNGGTQAKAGWSTPPNIPNNPPKDKQREGGQ